MISKELKAKAANFLQNITQHDELAEIVDVLKECTSTNDALTPCLLVLEHVFTELLKQNAFPLLADVSDDKSVPWLTAKYEETFRVIISGICHEKQSEGVQAMVTAMRLISAETRFGTPDVKIFPMEKLKQILEQLLSPKRQTNYLINRFSEYSSYPDVLHFTWKLIPTLAPKGKSPSDMFTQNFLALLGVLAITKEITSKENLCVQPPAHEKVFDYQTARKCLNRTWSCISLWKHTEENHKQLLIVLLEKMLVHLDKPILLTDFLMESLDMGGAIGLLALQGIFILIQQHNLTYPNIYEKLYSMFEPEIFHTKFKARLFYLADIFLSSTHLPESLVAAFAKRLARLALVAPPQDISIILYFIGNLIIRHPGLKRLLYHHTGGQVPQDPFIMDERDPVKSSALDSQLWEVAALQQHTIPTIATAAKFISNPLPNTEWDLSSVLEINENDIFDQEIKKKAREYALSFEKPMSMYKPKSDRTLQFWNLF
ncbi:nucleolar complex protein 4 homolog A [Culicoides brevitarsis]|uniref:nucleolar complex protein 4 homolog A n=1 Tax=Culicoides brevitarsis TaxID=469753 RepID=UPI00307C7DF3